MTSLTDDLRYVHHTCISSAKNSHGKENTAGSFINDMAQGAMNLEGWQVGVREIDFPNSWFVDLKGEDAWRASFENMTFVYQPGVLIDEQTRRSEPFNRDDGIRVVDSEHRLYHRFVYFGNGIAPRNYEHVRDVVDQIVKSCDELAERFPDYDNATTGGPPQKPRAKYSFQPLLPTRGTPGGYVVKFVAADQIARREKPLPQIYVSARLASFMNFLEQYQRFQFPLYVVRDMMVKAESNTTPTIPDVLFFDLESVHTRQDETPSHDAPLGFQLATIDGPPNDKLLKKDVKRTSCARFYVYSNVVAQHPVGSTMANLLLVVPNPGNISAQSLHKIYEVPAWHDCLREKTDFVRIVLKDDYDRPVQFEWGNAVLELIFKKERRF